MGGPYTDEFIAALIERFPAIKENSVSFGEIRGWLKHKEPSTVDGEQEFMLGAHFAEKGGGSMSVTLSPERDEKGNITEASLERERQAMLMLRSFQDSFPTVIHEEYFKNGLNLFSAHQDIRKIMTAYLEDKGPSFRFYRTESELDTSDPNGLGIPADVYDSYVEMFDGLNKLGPAALDLISDDELTTIFSRQNVLQSLGDFFLEQSREYMPGSMFDLVYNAMVRSVFTCNLMSSDTDGKHTINATARVLDSHPYSVILDQLEKNLREIYGPRFNTDVQISSMLFREGSTTEKAPLLDRKSVV